MQIYEIALLAPWLIVVAFIVYGLFTRRGRNKTVELQLGVKVAKDLGIMSEDSTAFTKQTVRLLECSQGTKTVYVLEVKRSGGLGFSYTYVKLDQDMLAKLKKI